MSPLDLNTSELTKTDENLSENLSRYNINLFKVNIKLIIIYNCSVMEVTSITDPSILKCSKTSVPIDNEQDFYLSCQPNVSNH